MYRRWWLADLLSNKFAPRNIARIRSTEVEKEEEKEEKEGKEEKESVVAEEEKDDVTDSNLSSREIARTWQWYVPRVTIVFRQWYILRFFLLGCSSEFFAWIFSREGLTCRKVEESKRGRERWKRCQRGWRTSQKLRQTKKCKNTENVTLPDRSS